MPLLTASAVASRVLSCLTFCISLISFFVNLFFDIVCKTSLVVEGVRAGEGESDMETRGEGRSEMLVAGGKGTVEDGVSEMGAVVG